ncbi:hypothetical protein [Halosimplex pelagicum]|uniref:Uncharacterized protein n=1 Tax=Halosimplex pelagicum TaxID=869886 RepID=A0A7D5PDI9_9EURY|nr:hypothetical protein [Halosimplex pelagicum]QLH81000.1 hypothetical protein HZS54_04830 [Halosimplex pelagicum]
MATTQSNTQNGTDDALPAGWARVPDDQLHHTVRAAFEHDSGLRVTIESMSRPDQMHDARSSRMDSGYVARVRDDMGADLCPELSAKSVARDAAREFAAAHPDGEFEVPDPRDQPLGPIDWRDE